MTRNIENRGEEGKEEEVAVGGAEGKCCHSAIYLGSVKLKHMSVLLLRSLTKSDVLEDQQSGLGK